MLNRCRVKSSTGGSNPPLSATTPSEDFQYNPRNEDNPHKIWGFASSPLWIQRNGNDASGEPYVTLACPECLRTFQQTAGGSLSPIREGQCAHCGSTVYYAIVEPVDWPAEQAPQRIRCAAPPAWRPQLQSRTTNFQIQYSAEFVERPQWQPRECFSRSRRVRSLLTIPREERCPSMGFILSVASTSE